MSSSLTRSIMTMLAALCVLPAFGRYKDIPKDSIRASFLATPVLSYSEETNWAFGIGGGYYFPTSDLKRASSITFQGMYTLNRQVMIDSKQKIYLDSLKRWYLESVVGYRYYPNRFYGLTNQDAGTDYVYLNNTGYLELHPEYELRQNLSLGGDLLLRYARVGAGDKDSANVQMDSIQQRWGRCGWGKQWQTGIGAHVTYDTRDSRFWPSRGIFAKAAATYYVHGLSTFPYARLKLDYRQYITTAREQVLCWQVYYDATVGQVPFYERPTLGGEDHMRGFREGQYNGQFSWGVQAEYRIPLFWRLSGVLFGSLGDAHEWNDWRIYKFKYAYGIGGRLCFNRQKTNVRADMAFDSYTHKPSFYITVGEAW